ncbi:M17 family metallopeptidase [Haliangium sp.]|uniref:M17 family metallopeptidase n=1 Tax=Haliangium sp. TaxID=2663208 RepID=UPI003D0F8EA5
MVTPSVPSAPRAPVLELHLVPAGTALPEGYPVRAPGGAEARAVLSRAGAVAHVALPARDRADLRWIVDQVVRALAAPAGIDDVRLFGPGMDPDTLATIALDLHQRTGGQVEVKTAEVAARVARVGPYEDGFRAWVNEDPSLRTSRAMARDVSAWAADQPRVTVEVLDEAALADAGLRLLLAVGGAGRSSPPRLILARYRPPGSDARAPAQAHAHDQVPDHDHDRPLLLLGKGITFDTGGINVKPYEAFVSMMKSDMAGAALAFTLFRALVEAGSALPLALALPACDNGLGSRAMKPGAVVESYAGTRVRIDHTDAEGRLILADALAYAGDRLRPRKVLCFATLTTAALVSYGPYATPVHFADPALVARLSAASALTGEDLHFFPERLWHLEANRDREVDLRNTARLPGDAVRGAGSRNAAHFLRHFAPAPLCHFDIFGSTWNWAGDAPGAGYGATGAPLRTLLRGFGIGAGADEALPGAMDAVDECAHEPAPGGAHEPAPGG